MQNPVEAEERAPKYSLDSSSAILPARPRLVRLDWETWNHSTWREDFATSVRQYITKSGEEITETELWQVFASAMLGQQDLLLLAAVEEEVLLGWALCRIQTGTAVTGPLLYLWQVWVNPRRAYRLVDLWRLAKDVIMTWGAQFGTRRAVMMTRRMGKGYDKILREMGFAPYTAVYQQEI